MHCRAKQADSKLIWGQMDCLQGRDAIEREWNVVDWPCLYDCSITCVLLMSSWGWWSQLHHGLIKISPQLVCTRADPVETLELLLIYRRVRWESAHSTTTDYRQLLLTQTCFSLLPVDLTCTNPVHGFAWVINSHLFSTVFCLFFYISRTFPLMYNLVFAWDQVIFHVYWF